MSAQPSAGRPSVTILVYHSISDPADGLIDSSIVVSPSRFRAQLEFLASRANVITLHEALEGLRHAAPLPDRAVVLTFDDGYRDNATSAYPLLVQYGLAATFFLASGFVGTDEMKWEDRVSCLIRRSDKPAISLGISGKHRIFHIRTSKEKARVTARLLSMLHAYGTESREDVLDQLREECGANCRDDSAIMMTWGDVKEIAGTPGMSIGAHTVTHPHLSHLSPDEVEREILESRRQIEENIGQPVRHFAYPYGDVSDQAVRILRQNDFECAGTLTYGRNTRLTDPYKLNRVQIPDSAGFRFSLGLRLRSSLFGEALKRTYNALGRLLG